MNRLSILLASVLAACASAPPPSSGPVVVAELGRAARDVYDFVPVDVRVTVFANVDALRTSPYWTIIRAHLAAAGPGGSEFYERFSSMLDAVDRVEFFFALSEEDNEDEDEDIASTSVAIVRSSHSLGELQELAESFSDTSVRSVRVGAYDAIRIDDVLCAAVEAHAYLCGLEARIRTALASPADRRIVSTPPMSELLAAIPEQVLVGGAGFDLSLPGAVDEETGESQARSFFAYLAIHDGIAFRAAFDFHKISDAEAFAASVREKYQETVARTAAIPDFDLDWSAESDGERANLGMHMHDRTVRMLIDRFATLIPMMQGVEAGLRGSPGTAPAPRSLTNGGAIR